jgi:hypothetical protein
MGRIVRVEVVGGITDDGQSGIDSQENQQPGIWQRPDGGGIHSYEAAQKFPEMVCEEPCADDRQAISGGEKNAGVGAWPDCLALGSALNEIAQVCKLLVTPR